MAKGNDGNYLQHCIEVAAALRLEKMDAEGRLHIALAHGMAPFEPFEQPKSGQCRRLLNDALNDSKKSAQCGEPIIVKAYRMTNASEEHYPNSAELLRAVIGKDKLSGGITEVDREKHKQLADTWSYSSVKPVCSSWRKQICSDGILSCPDNLQTPWLFTMDPMTYREAGDDDSNKLHRCDIDRLTAALRRYVASGEPGIAALFVYNVGVQKDNRQRQFWKFMDDLAERIGVHTCSYWLPHQGGNRNLAGLLCSDIDLSFGFVPSNVRAGRGCKGSI